MTFGNMAGLWVLLAVPVVLAIHLLQRKSRRVPVSTLFLLEQLSPISAEGRRLERLRNSLPLWLQLLAVLLVAWLVIQPRWMRINSVQTIVVVLDSSASMTAFREQTIAGLESRLQGLEMAAAVTEWTLLESDPAARTLYSGADAGALRAALREWRPRLGSHDVTPSLVLGSSILRGRGVLVFVTDHRQEVPAGVELYSVARPEENVGFVGVRVEDGQWRALVRNHGRQVQTRGWRVNVDAPPEMLTLQPGETRTLSGGFAGERVEVVLDGDAFPLDDRLPVVQPMRKPVSVSLPAGGGEFFEKFVASIPPPLASGEADVEFAFYDPMSPQIPSGNAIVFVQEMTPPVKYGQGVVVAERHPLTEELSWPGLLAQTGFGIPRADGDVVLVWQEDRPLISLRQTERGRALLVNFDVRYSNAPRLPAFVLLLHRFVEEVRAAKVAAERVNLETNQRFHVLSDPEQGALVSDPAAVATQLPLRAPTAPGFVRIEQDRTVLLEAGVHFADAREADLTRAEPHDNLAARRAELVERNSEADLLAPLWAVLLCGVIVGSWAAAGRRSR